jgi:hypothetical protein
MPCANDNDTRAMSQSTDTEMRLMPGATDTEMRTMPRNIEDMSDGNDVDSDSDDDMDEVDRGAVIPEQDLQDSDDNVDSESDDDTPQENVIDVDAAWIPK